MWYLGAVLVQKATRLLKLFRDGVYSFLKSWLLYTYNYYSNFSFMHLLNCSFIPQDVHFTLSKKIIKSWLLPLLLPPPPKKKQQQQTNKQTNKHTNQTTIHGMMISLLTGRSYLFAMIGYFPTSSFPNFRYSWLYLQWRENLITTTTLYLIYEILQCSR